jgi:hypothetical protein
MLAITIRSQFVTGVAFFAANAIHALPHSPLA